MHSPTCVRPAGLISKLRSRQRGQGHQWERRTPPLEGEEEKRPASLPPLLIYKIGRDEERTRDEGTGRAEQPATPLASEARHHSPTFGRSPPAFI